MFWLQPPRHHLGRRTRGIALVAVSAGLVPWAFTLWHQLPKHGHSDRSRNGWVALDIAEATAFGLAGYWHLRRDSRQLPLLRAGAALLLVDAVVDVSLAHDASERRAALALLPVEVGASIWLTRVERFARYELAGFDTEKSCRARS